MYKPYLCSYYYAHHMTLNSFGIGILIIPIQNNVEHQAKNFTRLFTELTWFWIDIDISIRGIDTSIRLQFLLQVGSKAGSMKFVFLCWQLGYHTLQEPHPVTWTQRLTAGSCVWVFLVVIISPPAIYTFLKQALFAQ